MRRRQRRSQVEGLQVRNMIVSGYKRGVDSLLVALDCSGKLTKKVKALNGGDNGR